MDQRRDGSAKKNALTGYTQAYSQYVDRQRKQDGDLLQKFRKDTADQQPLADQASPVAGAPDDPVARARQSVSELVPLAWLEADWEIVPEVEPGAENLLRLVPRFNTGRPGLFLRLLLDPHLLIVRARGTSEPPVYEAVRLRSPQPTGYSEGVVRGPGCAREQVQEAIARALVPYLTRQ